MKYIFSECSKILLWLIVLSMVGCSSVGGATSPVTVTPTLLSFPGKIAFISGNMPDYHIQIMNATGSGLIDITPPNLQNIRFLSWSPDGEYLAFSAWKDGKTRIFKIKADGSHLVQLTAGQLSGDSPSWSRDGKYIMFYSSNPNSQDFTGQPGAQINIMKSDGTEVRRFLVQSKPDNISMTGSFRGDSFISIEEPVTRYASDNYVVDLEGEIQKQFPVLTMTVPITWSPDGKFAAYSPDRRLPDCVGVVVIKFDRSERKCLLDKGPESSVYFGSISWSPDGKYILFSSNLDRDWNLYVIKPDGSGLVQLTHQLGGVSEAVWSIASVR